ncbi:MAG: hypothetical protein ACR2KQ_10785 [Actinomycetota bacterium]
MAIKGKKKSQSRGSQGTRRPASAPPPTPARSRRHTPFFKTRDGMLIIGIFVLVFLGVIAWLIGSARERSQELDAERAALEQYSDQVGALLSQANDPIREMVAVTEPSEEVRETLAEDAEGWKTDLQQVQGSLAQILPDPQVIEVNQLFNEALALYSAAADTFALVPEARGNLRDQIFTRAAVQRDTASALFETAIGVLNRMRADRDMPASGLLPPAGPPAGSMEVPAGEEIEIPVEGGAEEEGGGGDAGDGGNDGAEDE